jgi:hypothetical protein
MGKMSHGLFSKPSGKVGGITFGSARTQNGPQVTVRENVPPSDPKTPAQITQRSKFTSTANIIKQIGSDVYDPDFKRSVGQLAGYQSLFSIYLNAMESDAPDFTLSNTPESQDLGDLHLPDSFSYYKGAYSYVSVYFSTELGKNGHPNDQVRLIAVGATEQEGEAVLRPALSKAVVRYGGQIDIPIPEALSTAWKGWLYLFSVKANDPKTQPALSKTFWHYLPL